MRNEFRIHALRYPGGAGLHEYILIRYILRDDLLQRVNIALVVFVCGKEIFCIAQLCLYVAGQILFCGFIGAVAVLIYEFCIQQLTRNGIDAISGQFRNPLHIHAARFVDGHYERIYRVVGVGDGLAGGDGIL